MMKYFRPVQNKYYWLNSNDANKESVDIINPSIPSSNDGVDGTGAEIIRAISGFTDTITTKFRWKIPPINIVNGEITLSQIISVNADPYQIYCIRLINISGNNIHDSSGNDHIIYLNNGLDDGILGGSTIIQISNKLIDTIEIEVSQKKRILLPVLNNDNEIIDKIIYSDEFINGINTGSRETDTITRVTANPTADAIYNIKVQYRTLYETTKENKNISFTLGINIRDYNQDDIIYSNYKPDLKQKLDKLLI